MKLRPFSTWRQENKELLVFLAIAFALPFLWFLVPAIFSLTGNSLHSLSSFSLFNVLCPAAGAMVVSLVYRAEDPLLPRTFFRRFLGLTAIVGLWALCGLFLPEHFLSTVTPLLYFAVSLATIVFYLDEPSDLRAAYGLTGRQWTLSGVLLLLFLALLPKLPSQPFLSPLCSFFCPLSSSNFPVSLEKSTAGGPIFSRHCRRNRGQSEASCSLGSCGPFGTFPPACHLIMIP